MIAGRLLCPSCFAVVGLVAGGFCKTLASKLQPATTHRMGYPLPTFSSQRCTLLLCAPTSHNCNTILGAICIGTPPKPCHPPGSILELHAELVYQVAIPHISSRTKLGLMQSPHCPHHLSNSPTNVPSRLFCNEIKGQSPNLHQKRSMMESN